MYYFNIFKRNILIKIRWKYLWIFHTHTLAHSSEAQYFHPFTPDSRSTQTIHKLHPQRRFSAEKQPRVLEGRGQSSPPKHLSLLSSASFRYFQWNKTSGIWSSLQNWRNALCVWQRSRVTGIGVVLWSENPTAEGLRALCSQTSTPVKCPRARHWNPERLVHVGSYTKWANLKVQKYLYELWQLVSFTVLHECCTILWAAGWCNILTHGCCCTL